MENDQVKETKLSEKLLGELEVINLMATNVEKSVKEVRELISGNGAPEQNVRKNVMDINSKLNSTLEFNCDEIRNSVGHLCDALASQIRTNLGIVTEGEWFCANRHVVPVTSPVEDAGKKN